MAHAKLLSSTLVIGLLSALCPGHITSAAAADISWSAGAIGVVGPRYEGSKSYKVFAFPVLYPRFTGGETSTFSKRVSFKGADDIRFNLFDNSDFQVGPVLGYRSGRDESDGVLLGGLGDIDPSLVVGGYAAYQFGPILFDASIGTGVFGDASGFQARLGAETEYELNSQLKLTARIGTTISSDSYMDKFFGVTAAQAVASTRASRSARSLSVKALNACSRWSRR